MSNILAQKEAETLMDTVAEVKAEAIADALAARLSEVDA